MNNYELLLEEAKTTGLIVKEKPLLSSDGRIKGSRIAIRKDIETSKEKACVLAEELGHHHTTVGNILDQTVIGNRKQERQARLYAYEKLIGLERLIEAFESGCRTRYEAAELLGVTEAFLQEAIDCYRDKYGVSKRIGKYLIYFIPNFGVLKLT